MHHFTNKFSTNKEVHQFPNKFSTNKKSSTNKKIAPIPNKSSTNFLFSNHITVYEQTSQELQMLSSVTLNCQETKTVMNSGSLVRIVISASTFKSLYGR